ncbi:PDZ domain-containing protein [Pedobacter sp. HDW13]|uniref:S41 family peptidase n=1 Tax=unclassified Pedobacter TaxID=2628915 RepID=UPI000F59805D|nr:MULTISPECIES: S41 family peptidase [unclassified Pedobacter]QIL42267.1 PDZ domain-containing protein [Pedobacter sp. HDW13]RQO76491.1 peptidase S41 [Pedobacter sp. KBW01]
MAQSLYASCIKKLFFILLCSSLLLSCKKGSSKADYPAGSNENINTWILDSLKRYYYWNDQLPGNPSIDQSPLNFFSSVRNAADRFSYITLPNDAATAPASNRNFGFDYTIISDQNSDKVVGLIKVVLKDSPASRAGLKRGDYISKINAKTITAANAQALQQEILSNDRFTLTLAEQSNGNWADTRSLELAKGIILDQREISKVIESDGKKIGYLYFIDFTPGLASSLSTVFSNFKSQGVSDLILDLRYNSGGQVAEAAAICAMIAQNVSFDKPFIIYKGNKNGGTKTESIGSAATFDRTANFNTLLQYNLGLSRVYILTTAATASASEVMINNLKPFIQVLQIGEKTRGKDEASFKIFDSRTPKQVNWEMHPIVYKLFNASGNGGYSAGINPDISINELAVLPLLPFGDTADPMVKAAVARATGKSLTAVVSPKISLNKSFEAGVVLMDSRANAAHNSMVITHRQLR